MDSAHRATKSAMRFSEEVGHIGPYGLAGLVSPVGRRGDRKLSNKANISSGFLSTPRMSVLAN